jgi:phospholipid-binding lipoprotein MlaA
MDKGAERVMNIGEQQRDRSSHRAAICLLVLALAAGCARTPGVPGPDGTAHASGLFHPADADLDDDTPDYDPWRPFNEVMFGFNHEILDRFLVKPAATGWEFVVPQPARQSIGRALENMEMPKRFVNNVLQVRPIGAGREVARFVVNTTVGLAGLFDVASMIDIEKSDADTAQTFALYGIGAGPYLVLPSMPPLTVRDAIGRAADGAMDPIGYVLPFVANQVKSIVSAVNERSLNLKLYANVEESVLDLYSAARNGYLQRRRMIVRRAVQHHDEELAELFPSLRPVEPPVAVASAAPEDPL